MIYLFDIDGTLTEPQQPIGDDMVSKLVDIKRKGHSVVLVTGSTKALAEKNGQLTNSLKLISYMVFTCQGNECWIEDKQVYSDESKFSESLIDELIIQVSQSDFKPKVGNHIEERPGMINFSIVGRNANMEQRKAYAAWDKETNERKIIAYFLSNVFPAYDFRIGGEISIDIAEKGKDKGQILKYIRENESKEPIYFFGDKIMSKGNDFPLHEKLVAESHDNKSFQVNGPQETLSLLNALIV